MTAALTRRRFLQAASAAGTGLLLGFHLPARATAAAAVSFRPNAYVGIDADGAVTLWVTRQEMGQGVRTVLPMILADELEADWDTVRLVQATPGGLFRDIRLRTSGSGSASGTWTPLRRAAAAAREMLVAAAAARWGVPAADCRAERSTVVHPASGRRLPYGALAGEAAALAPPAEPRLKEMADLRLVGRPIPRVDGAEIVTGRAVYGLDVRRPGMLFAAMARSPVLGGRLRRFEERAARAVPGVRQVVAVRRGIATGVAVVADSTWAALAGRDALEVEWEPGPHAAFDSAGLEARLHEALAGPGWACRHEGDAAGGLAASARRLEATYVYPCAAHAPLEPMNCTAYVHDGRCEIWVPTQAPERAQADAAALLGIPAESVEVHPTLMGGGFGRRLYVDYVVEAVEVARAVAAPVQLVWTREDDMRHGFFHTAAVQRITAGVDAEGKLAAWVHACAGSDHNADGQTNDDPDPGRYAAWWAPWGAFDNPYAAAAYAVDFFPVASPVPAGPWRSVFYPEGVFARESMVDEIAHALGVDPIDYRLRLLAPGDAVTVGTLTLDRGRLQNVLRLVAERSGWATPLAPRAGRRRGRGVACNVYHGSTHIAQVAEVSVGDDGDVRVERVVCALDCGLVLNPLGVEAQVESAVAWGLSTALGGEITFRAGGVEQSSYADFPVVRIDRAPVVETHTTGALRHPHGLGEQPVPPVAPAVANAVFAATGRRLRRLPIRPADLARS